MKIGFIVPLLDEYDLEKNVDTITKSCAESNVDFDIIFALNSKLSATFTKIRNLYVENTAVKAFMVDRPVDQHKLITLAMEKCEDYDATIIYSGKEEVNADVIKAFITSYAAGNKIVLVLNLCFMLWVLNCLEYIKILMPKQIFNYLIMML